MKRVKLKPREDRRLRRGHLWVFRNELQDATGIEEGEIVDVVSSDTRFVGRGFFESTGGIAVRLLSRHEEPVDESFFQGAVQRAASLRETLYPGESSYRLLFGESDGLPGLVADRYGPVVTLHTSCRFYQEQADALRGAITQLPGVEAVRFDAPGGVERHGNYANPVAVTLDGLRFDVDLEGGQKTGLFLDQRENSRFIERLAPGRRVFDGHCYQGLWSLRAARAGAATVAGVDSSAPAVERARANAELNGLANACRFEAGDVAEALGGGERYGVVCIDPPALAKARAQVKKAMGLYQALNRAALAALEPGGYLVTSCCSHFVDEQTFLETVKRAARQVQRDLQLLQLAGAAPDHPVLLPMPETRYLTCAVFRAD
jgi:23S rRNA (cytosine1962-C5)-methyltransferase